MGAKIAKSQLISGYVGTWWLDEDGIYSVASGYKWLRGMLPKMSWHAWISNSVNLPKHCFIGWLIMRQRLLTKDRLCRLIGSTEDGCDLCGTDKETHDHLFFHCPYSRRCIQLLSDWCMTQLPTSNFDEWWNRQTFQSQAEGDVLAAILVAALYNVWWVRNQCRVNSMLFRPEYVVSSIQNVVRTRCRDRWQGNLALPWLH
ncbi:uncharacterized protein LOC141601563 [Silene latifolia]|uniref:uncharacterized protein LOC141601563 n=1 Tax=Silene latifolia TaxID=37657 RepID=UPI003D77E65C